MAIDARRLRVARVTLTIEGEHDELPDVIHQLFRLVAAPEVEEDEVEDWTEEELRDFVDLIQDDARRILAKVVQRPEAYPWDELKEELGLSGYSRAGMMSSVGHAENRFPRKPPIIERDYRQRVYRMDPDVAAMLAKYL
ncbi:MAG: hypothetical protein ACRDJC_03915 [Thermomicrobiales bacterium]